MAQEIKLGDKVEINSIWAYGGAFNPPLRSWTKGYEFISKNNNIALVRLNKGCFAGTYYNYHMDSVRKENEE